MSENSMNFNFDRLNIISSVPDSTPFAFSLAPDGQQLLLLRQGISSIMRESCALVCKHRLHRSADNLSSGVETQIKIPFGSEPLISRRLDLSHDCARFSTDIGLKSGDRFDYLEVDPLLIPGEWESLELIGCSGEVKAVEFNDANTQTIFADNIPFWKLKVFIADGHALSIVTGDDLWRWHEARQLGIAADFRVERTNEGILVTRKVLIMPEDSEAAALVPMRPRRFKWMFTLSGGADDQDVAKVKRDKVFLDPAELDLPDSAYVSRGGSVDKHTLCFHSSALQKRLRAKIRSLAALESPREIILRVAPSAICDNASHLDRGKQISLEHHDMIARMDLKLWADRQLIKSDSVLRMSCDEGD